MSGYGFTEDSARRIVNAVRKVEGDTTPPVSVGPRFTGSQMSVVKVTSVSTPLSLGIRLDYNAKDGVLEVQSAVKIKEVNGQNLKVNNYYVGFFSGYTSGGDPVFLVSVSGSSSSGSSSGLSSGSGSSGECFDVIQSIDCTDGELHVTFATICPDSGTAIIVGQQTGNYTINTRYSLTGGGSLSSGVILNLVNDIASPAASQYYGTNINSVRGWYDLPNTTNVTNSITGTGATATPFKLVNDTATPGNDKFYGTDGTGVRGWYDAVTTSTITTIEGNITTLQGSVTTIQGDITTLQSDMSTAQSDISSLQSALSSAESTIATLQSDLSTAQGTISSLQSDLSTAQGNISSLQSSVSSLESRVSALESA